MGDVGKYAVAHALKMPGVTVKPIAMTSRASAEPNFDIDVDVKPESLRQEILAALKDMKPAKIVVEDQDARSQLEEQFEGVDAVVACVGNRQSGALWQFLTKGEHALKSRWCESGARLVVDAMDAKGVKRLVLQSAFGIGDDYCPWGLGKVLHNSCPVLNRFRHPWMHWGFM
jgi:NAD(P)H-binding